MKKKLFAIIALLVILTGIVAGTVAYFTGSATAHNVIRLHLSIRSVAIVR